MAFPPINYCLICEEVRLERRNLVSLLGFYGIAPDVEILIRDFTQPVPRLTFLFVGGQGDGRFKTSMQILDEAGHSLVATPETEVLVQPLPKRTNLALGIAGFSFPSPGTYALQLLVEGRRHYETQFKVLRGNPDDFD